MSPSRHEVTFYFSIRTVPLQDMNISQRSIGLHNLRILLKESENLGDLGVHERILIKLIIKISCSSVLGQVMGFCGGGNEYPGSI